MSVTQLSDFLGKSKRYPAEWERQKSIWLAFPHNQKQWGSIELADGRTGLDEIREFFIKLMDIILDYQDVNLIFNNHKLLFEYGRSLESLKNKKYKLFTHVIPNNDIWIRDYGPFFMEGGSILDFGFNAWGEKFHPWDDDNDVPHNIAQALGKPAVVNSMILEGGSVEFSGDGLILTTEQCLLNRNRNPHLSCKEIENNLKQAFGVQEVIWLRRGLEGDHTDGHIDDFARFVGPRHILICYAEDKDDPNYEHLEQSYEQLKEWGNKALTLTRLPLPNKMFLPNGLRLPNSYANFIFLNGAVIVPTFDCPNDVKALEIIQGLFPDRKVIGINSSFLIQEGGGLHCMSKQEH